MNKKQLAVLLICSLILSLITYYDACAKNWHDGYRGSIAGEKGGLVLVFNEDKVSGVVYFDAHSNDIPVEGEINGRSIMLKSDKGLLINASFQEHDLRYGDEELGREVIKGKVISNEIRGDIYVVSDYGSAGSIESRYAIAGADNSEMVDAFAQQFKDAVLNKNREAVAKMLHYPLRFDDGEIEDRDEFIKRFDEIFYKEFLEAFKSANPKYMFSKSTGIMMNSDDNVFWIWISGKPLVISIFTRESKLKK